MTTHFADDKTLAELVRLERELAEAEKQINVLIAGLTEQTVRADENAAYAEGLKRFADGMADAPGIYQLETCIAAYRKFLAEHGRTVNRTACDQIVAEGVDIK